MRKLLFLLALAFTLNIQANPGDTTTILGHVETHWTWYGNYNVDVEFPDGATSYEKVLMELTVGCPSTGCSEWDYFSKISARVKTGETDTNHLRYPNFKINGSTVDSLYYSTDSLFQYTYDSTGAVIDSQFAEIGTLLEYKDQNDPSKATDTTIVWYADFYHYTVDSNGQVIDSALTDQGTLITLSKTLVIDTFDIIMEVELGRIITPYAGNYGVDWERKYIFDVTDLQSVLKDSVTLRAFYDGWQDGWLFSSSFKFIEGTPSRNVLGFENLWTDRFDYGNPDKPIAEHVKATTVGVMDGAEQAKLRITNTGHRFGGSENCAEFCVKTHEIHVNGSKAYDQTLWKDDCGMNPEYPQAGTWLYDRAGWCPGEPVHALEYDMSNYIAGDSITIDYQFDDYSWNGVNPPSPSYYIGTQLVFYGAHNFNNDAEMLDIISPTTEFKHSRFNPICGNPVVVIRNNGKNNLTTAKIEYGIDGLTQKTFAWTGDLAYMETDTVELNSWEMWNGTEENAVFYAEMKSANGEDEYTHNNRKESVIKLPPVYPSDFTIRFKTNNSFDETTYFLKDLGGNVLFSNPDSMERLTTYDQEVSLEPGCYRFEVQDAGHDGLHFWANSDGKGKVEFRTPEATILADVVSFDPDFGTAIYHQFLVRYELDVEDITLEDILVGPNPNDGNIQVQLNVNSAVSIKVYNALGQLIQSQEYSQGHNFMQVQLGEEVSNQFVWVKVEVEDKQFSKMIYIK